MYATLEIHGANDPDKEKPMTTCKACLKVQEMTSMRDEWVPKCGECVNKAKRTQLDKMNKAVDTYMQDSSMANFERLMASV